MTGLAYPDDLADGTVRLRPWTAHDVECVEQAATDPRIVEVTSVPVRYTPEEGLAFVRRQHERLTSGQGVSLAITRHDTGVAEGLVILRLRPQPGVAGLGYWVVPAARRHGLARRTVGLMAEWGLGTFDRIEAWVEPANTASCHVLAPGDDAATVTAHQVRQVVTRLIEAGHWQPGDPEIVLVADAGYDGPRLAFLLQDLPVVVLVRMRSDRVLRRSTPAHPPGTLGRPRRPGDEFVFGAPATWGEPDVTTRTDTRLYGPALARAKLPIIEGTVIRLEVGRLPSGAIPKPVWLWHSATDLDTTKVDLLASVPAPVRHRAHLPHAQTNLGWTTPKLRTLEQSDRCTWLILAAYTQLHLARDLRRPWENHPPQPGSAAGFGTSTQQSVHQSPHRNPPEHPNQQPAPHHDVHTVTSSDQRKPRGDKATKSRPAEHVETQARSGERMPSSSGRSWRLSPARPGASRISIGLPRPSTVRTSW